MNRGRNVTLALAWLGFFALGTLVFRYFVLPRREAAQAEQRTEESKRTVAATGSVAHYDHTVRVALDGFSGYWALRSPEFSRHLATRGIKVELYDDGANYPARFRALQEDQVDIAAFTVDAYLQTAANYAKEHPDSPLDKRLPGSIVLLVDETKGADALVGYRAKYPDIDSLNRPDTRFVLTPSSPSETLIRVVFGYFNLDKVDRNRCFVHTKSSQEVYEIARKADPAAPQVYGVWEPDLSKLLQNPNMQVIVDSSRFRGYIVDVLIFDRKFLLANGDVARQVVEAFLRTSYEKRNSLPQTIRADALGATNLALSDQQATRTVRGIWWKNTSENYAQMGVVKDTPLQHIEDMIRQIADMLIRSGAIQSDPTDGQPNSIYFPAVLQVLKESGFHPGISSDGQEVREEASLPALTEEQWGSLQKIGTLNIPDLVFPRGSEDLGDQSRETLDRLAENLKTWPTYYVTVEGNAAPGNQELALARAVAAERYLIKKGTDPQRIRARQGQQSGRTRVNFILGQQPY